MASEPAKSTDAQSTDAQSTNATDPDTEWMEVGRIVGAQGLKGEVRVYPDSDFPERFLEPGTRWLQGPGEATPRSVKLVAGRLLAGKNLYVVKFAEVGDRTQAEALRGAVMLVPAGDRLPLEEDEFHVRDLIGLEVWHQVTQTQVGTVTDLIAAGNDLLEVKLLAPQGKTTTVLIPFVRAIVPVVDLPSRRLEITPPDGLLP
ncbi:ribosome maturation factor RimM [Thermoleptolyngbya sichuanensis A183]|uniref:Ribosome maturation factor RimM n=1 Tax=Thermoleptolyngbya sichuanensis A183 TaxID=2737172 RepID=A0A6M8BG87_9CYAN|nr:ribosome maturation factor RimM [Thermoleptolyngbya sichuanensis A183]